MQNKFVWLNLLYILLFSTYIFAAEENNHEPWVEDALNLAQSSENKFINVTEGVYLLQDNEDTPRYFFKRLDNEYCGDEDNAIREEIIYKLCQKYPSLRPMVLPYAYVKNVTIHGEVREFTGIECFLPAYTDSTQLEKIDSNLKRAILNCVDEYDGSMTLASIEGKYKLEYQASIINNIDPLNYYTLLFGSILLNFKDATLRNILCYLNKNGKIGLCFTDTGESLGREVGFTVRMMKPQIMFIGDFASKPFPKEVVDFARSLNFEEMKKNLLSLAPLDHYNCRYKERDEVIEYLREDFLTHNIKNKIKIMDEIIELSKMKFDDPFVNLQDRLAMFQDNLEDMKKLPVAEFIFKHSTGEFSREFFKCYESGGCNSDHFSYYGFNKYKLFSTGIQNNLTCTDFWDKMYKKYKKQI